MTKVTTVETRRREAGSERDATAAERDRVAEFRDRGAEDRDVTSSHQDQIGLVQGKLPWKHDRRNGDGGLHHRRDREESGRDRVKSAEDRGQAADDRIEAARERVEALNDRTQADAAAQRALETLESMSDAFLTLDTEWRFTYLNPQTEAILNCRREDLLGANMWEAFPESIGTGFEEAFRRALRDQETVRFEAHYEPLGRTIELRIYPVLRGLAVYFTDVTHERLRDVRHRESQRLEALGQVTAGVAHDFANLLTAVGGFAQLGQARCGDEVKARYLFDEIDSASRKAMRLTRQLLTFSREQHLSAAPVDLNEVVEGVFSLLEQLVPPAVQIRLALSVQPVVVIADRSQLEQVLINLVVNSRDAIDADGSIRISTLAHAPSGVIGDVRGLCGWFQVTDSGCGIPDDVMPRIFDPYFSTKPHDQGTGLGLSTIYGIVSQSRGSIFVDSTVGIGTTITVALPAEAKIGYVEAAVTV